MVIGHHVDIETVPQRVARAALQLDEMGVTGAHFTLKLANSGRTSVGRARFKSPSRTHSLSLERWRLREAFIKN